MNDSNLCIKIFQIITVLVLIALLMIYKVDTKIISTSAWLVMDCMIFVNLLLIAVLQFQNRNLMVASIVSMLLLIVYYAIKLPKDNCNWWLANGIFISVLYWSITST